MGTDVILAAVEDRPCLVVRNLLGRPEDIETLEKRLAENTLEPGLPWLIDNQGSSAIPETHEVKRLASFFTRHQPSVAQSRIAWVAPSVAAYGMGRVLQVRVDHLSLKLQLFRSREEAVQWILGDSV